MKPQPLHQTTSSGTFEGTHAHIISPFNVQEKPVKVYVNIFTYGGDEEIVKYSSVCAFHNIPNSSVFVIDDANNPVSEETVKFLQERGIYYRKSEFDRKFNLNGKSCILGMLRSMEESYNGDKDGITIKVDSDTLILNPEFIRNLAINSTHAIVCSTRLGYTLSGICYGLKNEIIPSLIKTVEELSTLPEKAPEDVTILGLARIIAYPKDLYQIVPYETDVNINGKWTSWNYGYLGFPNVEKLEKAQTTCYKKMFHVVTYGDWKSERLQGHVRYEPMRLMCQECGINI